jgi:hypothetical protein
MLRGSSCLVAGPGRASDRDAFRSPSISIAVALSTRAPLLLKNALSPVHERSPESKTQAVEAKAYGVWCLGKTALRPFREEPSAHAPVAFFSFR